jgi:hypothetical protein
MVQVPFLKRPIEFRMKGVGRTMAGTFSRGSGVDCIDKYRFVSSCPIQPIILYWIRSPNLEVPGNAVEEGRAAGS